MLWICVVIGVIVFGAMAYAMFKFRKSKGAVPDTDFTHSTKLEIIWTVVPIVILVGSGVPGHQQGDRAVRRRPQRDADEMTVKVTGYQWMWRYEYVGEDVNFISRLDRESDRIRQSGALPDAAEPPALPARRRQSAGAAGRHQDPLRDHRRRRHPRLVGAGAGLEAGRDPRRDQRGLDRDQRARHLPRRQCAELCGKDHGFMPIVVKAVPQGRVSTLAGSRAAKAAAGRRRRPHRLRRVEPRRQRRRPRRSRRRRPTLPADAPLPDDPRIAS